MPLPSTCIPQVFRDCKFQINASLCAKVVPSIISFCNALASLMEYMHDEKGRVTLAFAKDFSAIKCSAAEETGESCPDMNLSMAVTNGNEQVTLTITDSLKHLNASYSYVIKRETVQVYPAVGSQPVTGTSITYTDTGLTNGTDYDYECIVSKEGCDDETCAGIGKPTAVSDCTTAGTLTIESYLGDTYYVARQPLLTNALMSELWSYVITRNTGIGQPSADLGFPEKTVRIQYPFDVAQSTTGIQRLGPRSLSIFRAENSIYGRVTIKGRAYWDTNAMLKCNTGETGFAFEMSFYNYCGSINVMSVTNTGLATVEFDVTDNLIPEEVILYAAEFTAPSTVGTWFEVDRFNSSTTVKPHALTSIAAVIGSKKVWNQATQTWHDVPIYETYKSAKYSLRGANFPATGKSTHADGSVWLTKQYAICAVCRNNINLPAGNTGLSILTSSKGAYRIASADSGPLAP